MDGGSIIFVIELQHNGNNESQDSSKYMLLRARPSLQQRVIGIGRSEIL
jgi:hypothetical protein